MVRPSEEGAGYSEPVASSMLLQQISDAAPTLSRSERRVAEYVLAHSHEVVHSTLAALASAIGVSEPTVVRFCSSLGFSGFGDFRMQVAQFHALGMPATHSAIEATDPPGTIVTKIFDHTISSLAHTRRSIDQDSIEQVVQLIGRARRLHFFGAGASSVIAFDAAQKSPLFGRPCLAEADAHQQFIEAASADADDLFFLISYTGRTLPLPEIGAEARRNGATVVAITGTADGPVAAAADVVIVTASLEDTDLYTPTISRIAGLVVIDILATATAMLDDGVDTERLRGMKQKLAIFRATMSQFSSEEANSPVEGEVGWNAQDPLSK